MKISIKVYEPLIPMVGFGYVKILLGKNNYFIDVSYNGDMGFDRMIGNLFVLYKYGYAMINRV